MMRPTGVTRGSSLAAQTAPVSRFRIHAHGAEFVSVNGLPPKPTRTWRYRMGPAEDKRTASAVSSMSGAVRMIPSTAITRLITV